MTRAIQALIVYLSLVGSLVANRIDSLSIQHREYAVVNLLGPMSGDGFHMAIVSGCGFDIDCIGLFSVFDLHSMMRTDVPFQTINALSVDGTFVGGRGHDKDASIWGPATWDVSNGLQVLEQARNSRSHVTEISSDGQTVAGRIDGQPFIGTVDGIIHPHGAPAEEGAIVAMSNDGLRFAGHTFIDTPGFGESKTIVFRWSFENQYDRIGVPEGAFSTLAATMSEDGRVVAGTSSLRDGSQKKGFRWIDGQGFEDLGNFIPTASTDDGDTLVGFFDNGQPALRVPAIWDPINGAREFDSFLTEENSIPLRDLGWTNIQRIEGISQDGRTFIGSGYNTNGNGEWIVRLGEFEACDLNADGTCDVGDIDAFGEITRSHVIRSSFDLDSNGRISGDDRDQLLDIMGVSAGDANLDQQFNSSDLTIVFQAGLFESAKLAGWSEGDWTGDGVFDTEDLVSAFETGAYEQGPRVAENFVPEPTSFVMLIAGLIVLPVFRTIWRCGRPIGEMTAIHGSGR